VATIYNAPSLPDLGMDRTQDLDGLRNGVGVAHGAVLTDVNAVAFSSQRQPVHATRYSGGVKGLYLRKQKIAGKQRNAGVLVLLSQLNRGRVYSN
jgi:hypothetical protein